MSSSPTRTSSRRAEVIGIGALLARGPARRRGLIFIALVAITLLLMVFSSSPAVLDAQRALNAAFRPIQGVLDDVAENVASAAGAIGEIDVLRADNKRLSAENERLVVENARLAEIRRQNELLAGLLAVRNGLDHETVAAEVIARESSEFRHVVTVGKGTDEGIARGDVVIAEGGSLAGRVFEAGPNFAKVLLITDTESVVIGQLPSAATGEVRGQVSGVLVMGRIDASEHVEPGSEVVTAGIELADGSRSPFPKALLVGRVIDVRRDANAIVQTAYLAPAAAVDRLEWVLIITDYEGGLRPIEEQPQACGPGDDGTLPDGERPCASPAPSGAPAP